MSVKMDAHHTVATTRRPRQSPRRQIRNGQRAAALRAITAAKFYLRGEFKTVSDASESCGANVKYTMAASVLLRAGYNLDDVLSGNLPLLTVADELRPTVELVEALERARPRDLARAGRRFGAEKLFTSMVEPALDSDSTIAELRLAV
jgi:hypothetical protein